MKKEELLSCQFSHWYPNFRKHTIKSFVIPLPNEFVEYLQADGSLVMPKGVELGQAAADKDWDEGSWEDNLEEGEQPDFEGLIHELSNKLAELGGIAFPKLNWSAPKDAVWINNNTLKCSSPGEIILLLKSSDFIQYDLSSLFMKCEDASDTDRHHEQELVLRKWANLSPGMEFRCFVRNKQLVGISQRDWRQYFDFIEAEKELLVSKIQKFINEKVLHQFPSHNFVVDLYKKRSGKFWIIDFNPFDAVTDPLLFTWEELTTSQLSEYNARVDLTVDGQVTGQFRFADKNTILQPCEYLSYRMPVDFVDLSTGSDATKLVDFMRMKIQNESDEDASESEDEQWRLPT